MTDPLARLREALAGRYRIDRQLGEGGMATVYLAHDLRHDREVALKVLRPELAVALGADRFLQEIRITAALTHPHILPLLDSGDAGGVLYYVMPYVAGESLRDRLDRQRQLPVDEALRIAREVADALSYAHGRDVVHRDIKPENILLEAGHAVVADFGIARAVRDAGGDRLTETGLSVGTPTYMSPEQAAGERDVDGRTDIYALGCMLHEMLAGQPPFTGPTAESVIRQHLVAEPPSIVNLRPGVPDEVVAVLARALAKTPADRFSPAAQFADALAPVSAGLALGRTRAQPAARSGPASRWAVAAAIAGVAVIVGGLAFLSRGGAPAGEDAASVAVLPFASLGSNAEQEYFGDGLTDELINALSKIPGLQVTGRASAFYYKGRTVDAREVGRELGVAAVLDGSVQRAGDRIRVRAQLTNADDGFTIWSETYDRELRDLFAVQDEIARAIVAALSVEFSGADSTVPLAATTTTNLDAYNAYLQGRYHWNRRTVRDLERAVELFASAIASDSTYAPAWSGLADSYLHLLPSQYPGSTIPADEALRRAEAAAQRAVALAPDLAESHTSLGLVQRSLWQHEASNASLRRALRQNPGYAPARHFLAANLLGANHVDEAVREWETAHRADPLSLIIGVWLAVAYSAQGDMARADATWDRIIALFPTAQRVREDAALHAMIRDRWSDAVHHLAMREAAAGRDSAAIRRLANGLLEDDTRAATLRTMVRDGVMTGSRAVSLLALAGDPAAAAARADEIMPSPARAGTSLSSLRARIADPRVFRHPRFRAMLDRVGVRWD